MRALKISISVLLLALLAWFPVRAQVSFDEAISLKMTQIINETQLFAPMEFPLVPSNNLQSVTTPSGWSGGKRAYLFFVLGGIYPALYATPAKPDLISSVGGSVGDPSKYVNVSASVNVGRVSEIRDLSANLVVSRRIFKASSIAVGALQVLASKEISDAPDQTYFIAFSHAIQGVKSKADGYSALGYTIGFGTGRFLYKSPMDIATGKGKKGTGVFANVSYEIIPRLNVNTEWSGLNLGFSVGIRPLATSAITMGFGAYNLTKYSGDRITYMAVIGVPLFLSRNQY